MIVDLRSRKLSRIGGLLDLRKPTVEMQRCRFALEEAVGSLWVIAMARVVSSGEHNTHCETDGMMMLDVRTQSENYGQQWRIDW